MPVPSYIHEPTVTLQPAGFHNHKRHSTLVHTTFLIDTIAQSNR
jgi:hypothetical protein